MNIAGENKGFFKHEENSKIATMDFWRINKMPSKGKTSNAIHANTKETERDKEKIMINLLKNEATL